MTLSYSLKKGVLLFALLLSSVITLPASLAAVDLHSLSLSNLRSNEMETLIPDREHPTIIMFMQPDCSWCKKQAITLSNLVNRCETSLNIKIIGFNGKKTAIKREIKHYDKKLPIYMANRSILRNWKGIETSPTLVFLDKNAEFLGKFEGYLPPQKMFKAVSAISNGHCQLES